MLAWTIRSGARPVLAVLRVIRPLDPAKSAPVVDQWLSVGRSSDPAWSWRSSC